MNAEIHRLNREAQAADDRWSALLHKAFGKQAGDVRYTPRGHGEAGTALRAAYDRFCVTRDAWWAAVDAERKQVNAMRSES